MDTYLIISLFLSVAGLIHLDSAFTSDQTNWDLYNWKQRLFVIALCGPWLLGMLIVAFSILYLIKGLKKVIDILGEKE